jgi:cytochrome c oxidase cbb3-type subunit 3
MRPKETYTSFIAVALGLSLAILASFQIYIQREPSRIANDEAQDLSTAKLEGFTIYAQYCIVCHGSEGEGIDAPALNDSTFLRESGDERIFSLISSGVPGTEMPAWSQLHGGPFTDQQIAQLVTFIRSWEPNAPDRQAEAMLGDAGKGLMIFNSTCIICHGDSGIGTERAPALNDPLKLSQFDDQWYIDTISQGRPSQGMPTWGTVLSPAEIRDLIALLRAWENGEEVSGTGS